MPIAIRSGGSLTGSSINGGNITINLPAGTATGDVVYVMATTNGLPSMGTSGYTQITTANFGSGGGENAVVFRKVMGATPDTTCVINGTGSAQDSMSAVLYVLTGVNTTTPEDATSPTAATGSSVNPNPPAIVIITRTAWVLAYAATDVVNTISSYPSGYSGGISINGNDNNDTTAAVAYKSVDPAGSEDPGTYTINATAAWGAMTVAVRPAGFIRVDVTGVSATGAVGTTTQNVGIQVSPTGVSGTGAVGTAVIAAKAKVDITGVSATGAVGTVTVKEGAGALVTGVEAKTIITGVTTSTDAFTGWGANSWDGGAWGDNGIGVIITPASFVAIGEIGSIEIYRDITFVFVTGVSADNQLGSVEVWENEVVAVTGVAGTGQVGTVRAGVIVLIYVTGQSVTGYIGTVTVKSANQVNVLGVVGSAELSDVSVRIPKLIPVSGLSATGQIGNVIVYGGKAVFVTGVYCTAQLSPVAIWITINDAQPDTWIPVDDQEVADWVEIPV